MRDPSRGFRWTLLLASLLTIGFLVAAAVRENYLGQWYRLQRGYRELLRAKATDDRGRELLKNFRVELRQITVPQLGAVDRCVTCHNGVDDPRMTKVPQPHAVHPGDILKNHPLDRYGCTVCHHGQGAATNFRDAKADNVSWDYPLLNRNLTQSSCLSCHDIERLPREQVSLLIEGKKLYEEKSCGSCHKLGGRGGTLGPPLDNEGAKTRHQLIMANLKPPYTTDRWHESHFRDPGGIVPGSQMKNPAVTEHEALALTVYMLAQWQRDIPASYLAADKIEQKARALHAQPTPAAQIYQQYCTACHGDGTYGRWDNTFRRFIPAIRGESLIVSAEPAYLEAQIARGRPGTQMPAWAKQAGGLQSAEIGALVDYLRSGAPHVKFVATSKALLPHGDAGSGAVLFAQNCAGCHGLAGHGGVAPELANPTLQQAASDAFIVATIRNGRRGAAMPAFQRPGATGLTDTEIADLLAFIRKLAPGAHKGPTKAETASSKSNSAGSGGTR